MPFSRRQFLYGSAAAGAGLFLSTFIDGKRVVRAVAIPGGNLDPGAVSKFATPLLIPPVMPRVGTQPMDGRIGDYYEISVRQFAQQILPSGFPPTTVWGYGPKVARGGPRIYNAPSLTIEADWRRPVRIRWINELVDDNGNYLPHLLPVDPTLHWANPPGGTTGRDTRPSFASTPGAYTGPVPMVTHVHGAVGVGDESDGYPEAWFLPAAANIPAGFATEGTWYDFFKARARISYGAKWEKGSATFQYPNLNRASTIWYHDHTLGMTRLNVYAGPAGFYLVRGGPDGDSAVRDTRSGRRADLPGPAPRAGDSFPSPKTYYEIPIAIQDRSFNADGSLFYPDTRAFFDGIVAPLLPEGGMGGQEGFSPIWNPEFFGNAIIANGNTWPYQVVEKRRYRFRFLNGCQSRFLILDFKNIPGVEVWQIGNEGGFLAAPVDITADHDGKLLMGLAERADVIVDFTGVPEGSHVLGNVGPDEPFGGGIPGIDFPGADVGSTGQVMEFRVVPAVAADPTTPPRYLRLPDIRPLPAPDRTRPLALIEKSGEGHDAAGQDVEGPVAALLGTAESGTPISYMWMDQVTEDPRVGDTEVWEFYNTTADAHPMHIHEVTFEVINREVLEVDVNGDPAVPLAVLSGTTMPPEPWETGFKDTVIAYPGQVTRVKATFANRGQYVWHCHIVEHEDNEMMRPFRIGLRRFGQPR